jgi:hypothetical protein
MALTGKRSEMNVTSNFGPAARRVNVRKDYSAESVWRSVLSEPLHVASIDGPLDAPDNMPAGAMRSTASATPQQAVVVREGSILWW